MLTEFIKDKRGNRVGVVVAIDKNAIGWSVVNTKLGDEYSEKTAMNIAIGRAEKGSVDKKPSKAIPIIEKMKQRAERYFK